MLPVSSGRRLSDTLRFAWADRRALDGLARRRDELAFLPASLSLQATPPHPAPRVLALTLCALFAIALGWAVIGQLDIVAVAPGRVVVSEKTKAVQPLEASVVRRVWVHDGDSVQQGQLLVELDPTNAGADTASLQEQLDVARSEHLRSQTLATAIAGGGLSGARASESADIRAFARPAMRDLSEAAQSQLHAEWRDITARIAKLNAESARRQAEVATVREVIGKLEATLPIARQRENDFKALSEQGFISSHANQDRTRERIEQERDLATQRARLAEAEAALREASQARQAVIAETQRTLSDRAAQAKSKQQQLAQEMLKADQRSRLTRLTAPVSGTIQQLAVHTDGGVVTPAQVLMIVVPKDAEVTAEVVVENKDIGFVHVGQRAEIKLETFPFTRYGTIEAVVKGVAADAVNDEKRGPIFPARLTLMKSAIDVDGKRIAIAPGMAVSAEIKTGKRRVIDYLLSPVQTVMHEGLRER